MSRKLIPLIVLGFGFGAWLLSGAEAQKRPDLSTAGLSAEVQELRRLVEEMSRQLKAVEARISRLESRLDGKRPIPQLLRTGHTRRLGRYNVDEHGAIVDETGAIIGIWGVNGDTGHVDGPAERARR